MMQQYLDAKAACGDALLFFRMGDFYELFHDDAKIASQLLGLTLTSRDKSKNPIPMAGFPHHQLEGYLAKLIAAGRRAAVCDQVEDPKKAQGLVRREITRVVSPGTLTDEGLLDPREENFLAAVAVEKPGRNGKGGRIGLSWADLSTGRFFAAVYPATELASQLARIHPAECLINEDAPPLPSQLADQWLLTERPGWTFAIQGAQKTLLKHFEVAALAGFGFEDRDTPAIQAAGAVLAYLQETQKVSLSHLHQPTPRRSGQTLELDEATRRSLELTHTIRHGSRQGTLLDVLDRATTSMGSRLLHHWLANPLVRIDAIEARLDAVEELHRENAFCGQLRELLREVYDIERLLARVATGRASPRDLGSVQKTLGILPKLKAKLTGRKSSLLGRLERSVNLCADLRNLLDAALNDDCPLTVHEGGIIRAGHHEELDRLRALAAGGKQWIAEYQAQEAERTEIPSLKVGFNKVFGYYLEITNAHRDKAPPEYIRKQTLKNAERYITPELKEYEEKVLTADDKAKEIEYELFMQLRDAVQRVSRPLQETAAALAQVDALAALAETARKHGYCRPEVVEESVLEIIDGRHPVVDALEPEGVFVPNDTHADERAGRVLLITGPNMAGKSTYIRQVALITIMAQMGGFTPARKAKIGMADRIFARVGASDELSRGQSTFMVEMTETARILNTATDRSLVILDEIGRGTSTYDGLSLAWAIVEHLHDKIGSRTLFATHYHELTDLADILPGVVNWNVAVQEWEENVVFLHKITPGAADKSYGIHVARLAGVPKSVNERAKQVLAQLENDNLDAQGRPKLTAAKRNKPQGDIQLTLFGPAEHPVLDDIRNLDLNNTTPLEALLFLQARREELLAEKK